MRYISLSLSIIVCCTCSNPHRQEIIVPELRANFYANELHQIDARIKSNPPSIDLIKQKLYYCDQLDWPTTCISALDQYRAKFGMTNLLVGQYIKYYSKHAQYRPLIDVIEKWNKKYDLEKKIHQSLIISLVNVGQHARAKAELSNFLVENQSIEGWTFVSKQYLHLNDTLMAIYNLTKLDELGLLDSSLVFPYGKLLVELGYPDHGFEVLEKYYASAPKNVALSLLIAGIYEAENELGEARNKLKPFVKYDTLSFLLSDWYKKDLLWDSAIMYLDSVIYRDPTNTKAWRKRGKIYEDRGWLSSSLKSYKKIVEINPTDSMAVDKVGMIRQKITYLRRKKIEQNKVPVLLELNPIQIKHE